MSSPIASVEFHDLEAQGAWRSLAEAGAGSLASSYVLCTAIVALGRAGVGSRLSKVWTPLADLVPAGGVASKVQGVLRYLALRDVTESQGNSWRLTSRGEVLLRDVTDAFLGYYVEAYGGVLHDMGNQLAGRSCYGADVVRDAEALGRRCEVLFRSFGTKLVAEVASERGARRILDLGCGTGGLLIDLCLEMPSLQGMGLDIAPETIVVANERASSSGISDRVRFVVGDAFVPETWPTEARSCDFYVAVGAIHEHFRAGEGAVVGLLQRYAELLRANGSTLLLAEPELYGDATDADFFLVHVLTDQGMPRPREQWLRVFEAGGLSCSRVLAVPNTGFRFAYFVLNAASAG